jgi:two-component system sensor histidine kinase DegS
VELAREAISEDPEDAMGQLRELRKMVTLTIDSVRQTSRDLRPTVLEDLGMVPALQYLVNELARQDTIDVSLEVEGTTEGLPPGMEVAIYRIVQEALTNVRRHARASRARVEARFLADEIIIVVEDDGLGFDMPQETADLVNAGALGLMGLKERAQLFGGQVSIDSQAGRGTTVRVVLSRNLRPSQLSVREPEAE